MVFLFFLSFEARAQTPTPQQFVARFVQVLNDRLERENAERALKGGRLYCSQLSDEQITDLERLFITNTNYNSGLITYQDLKNIRLNQFIAIAADQLHCYPTFWPTKGRSSIGGVLFNSKSFVMDTLILKAAIQDLAKRTPEEDESLAEVYRP